MTPILAHFGHWYASLFYAVPFVVIVGALKLQTRRDRRREGGRAPGADDQDDEDDQDDQDTQGGQGD